MRPRRSPRQLALLEGAPQPAGEPAAPAGRGRDALLIVIAVIGGAFFFWGMAKLWPLARTDLTVPPAALVDSAGAFLSRRGLPVDGFASSTRLAVNEPALDYVERAFGNERAQAWIDSGLPIVSYVVSFKRGGDPDARTVRIHPRGGIVGWERELEEDEPGSRIGVEEARGLVRAELEEGLGLDPAAWEEKAASTSERPARRDHAFVHERTISENPELRERVHSIVSGAAVSASSRVLVVPGPARREARAREAPGETLQAFGIALLAVAAVAAFVVFLRRLRDGTAQLGRAATWIAVLGVTQLLVRCLETPRLFAEWETLWPRWASALRSLVYGSADLVWTLLVLLAFLAAGDALDRASGAKRGDSLWALGRGRFTDAAVAAASIRGFLVGLVCGGVLALVVVALQAFAGARVSIQPRGFFFYALNSASPSASTALFFLYVALAEELGYRFFGTTWLLSLGKRRYVAILVPALIYGLTHTTLDFLPPAEPFWGRPLALTLVGCVWGWAFLRYDALTVVLSHYTADLVIFSWPRLASGRVGTVLAAAVVVALPLLPAVARLLRRRARPS